MSRMTDPKIVSTRSMDEESVISILASTSDLDSLSELSTKSDPGEPGTIPLRSPQPLYLPVRQTELCWRCGEAGHRRFTCRGKPTLFCSRCGLSGVMSRDCGCLDARQAINRRKLLKKKAHKQKHLRWVPKHAKDSLQNRVTRRDTGYKPKQEG